MSQFSGFPERTVTFLSDLAKNNKKDWFDAHKDEFNRFVIDPAKAFTEAMGEHLTAIAPGIIAEPRVNGSIFRIYRDARFSKDKTPYKTHLGIFMWEGEGAKMECPGFYFHLEPPKLMLGAGIHTFSKPLLEEFRRSVTHPKHGHDLAIAATNVSKLFDIGGRHYKRVPAGYDKDSPYAPFLLFNGLTAWVEEPIPTILHSSMIVDHCMRVFQEMAPVHRWLLEMAKRARAASV